MRFNELALYASLALMLGSCVTARQYEELEAKHTTAAKENDKLKKQNSTLTTSNTELEAQLEDANVRIEALASDTTILGTSLRHMKIQYDKINELNEILSSKNDRMLQEAIDENRGLLAELEEARLELQKREDDLMVKNTELEKNQADYEVLSAELETREKRVNELEDLLAQQEAAANALRDKVTKALLGFKDKGLTIEQRDGKVYVSMEANLLFPSGSTKINEEGKGALIDLAKAIESQADLEIIVEGHTDTDALNSANHPRDNWELSVLRATSVVKIMRENSAIQPTILTASGRSEHHPVDPEDKAKNRRIEIILAPNLGELFDIIEG